MRIISDDGLSFVCQSDDKFPPVPKLALGYVIINIRVNSMKKCVLIVEDDKRISNLIYDYFSEAYEVIEAGNGAQALIEFETRKIDLVILDIMLPVLDGWEVCRQIRSNSTVPIIMLTAKSDEQSNLKGFEQGVDDYVTKPFSPKVLLAKAGAIFKRLENAVGKPQELYHIDNSFTVNEASHKVIVQGEAVNLTATEFALLLYLIKNTGLVVTRDNILDHVWGENYFGDYRIVDTNIKRTREKLGEKAKYIKTIRGLGYKFEVE